jgi:hypothetical protein
MGIAAGVWMIVLGVLAASNLIIARKPDATQLIGKLSPYQGWIGAVSALWGAWLIITAILNLGWLSTAPIWWLTYAANAVLVFSLGLLLGIGVLKSFIKHPQAVSRMDQMIVRLAPKQGVLGLIGIGVGAWMILARFMIR